jgi:hypothetical protein
LFERRSIGKRFCFLGRGKGGNFPLTNADQLLTNADQYLPFLEISASHANCIIDELRQFALQTQE